MSRNERGALLMHAAPAILIIVFSLSSFLVAARGASSSDQHKPAWPIDISYLTSPDGDDRSALSAECDGDTGSPEITCTFSEIDITRKLEREEAKEWVEEIQEGIKGFLEGKDMKDVAEEACEGLDLQKIQTEVPGKEALAFTDKMTAFCDDPSITKLEGLTLTAKEMALKTCVVDSVVSSAEYLFQRTAPNRWVFTGEPHGACKTVLTITLEHEHEPGVPSRWTYTETSSYDEENPACEGTKVGKPEVYDWKKRPFPMDCEYIEYGF
jgi:hypothetical protein